MKKFYFKTGFLIITALSFFYNLSGQLTYTWIGANNASWATSTNWSPTRSTPAANDILQFTDGTTKNVASVPTQTIGRLLVNSNTNITLQSAGTITLTVGNGADDDIAIAAGSSLTIGGSNTLTVSLNTNATANISGTLTINAGRIFSLTNGGVVATVSGSIINSSSSSSGVNGATAAKLIFSSTGTYEHALNSGTIPLATWNATSNCIITGVTNTIPTNNVQNFGHFTWNCSGQSANETFSAVLAIQGNLTIQNTGANELRFNNDQANTVGGNYVQTGGFVSLRNNNAHSLTVSGSFELSGGTFENAGDNSPGGVLNVAGNFFHTGGTLDGGNLLNVFFNGSGTQIYRSGGTVTGTTNYTVSNGAFLQTDLTGTVLTGTAFTLSSGATLGIRSTAGITSSGATGNIQTTTRTYSTGANYIYNGAGGAQVTGNGLPATANSITINNSAGVTLSQALALTGYGTFTNGVLITTSTNLLTFNDNATVSGASNSSHVSGPVRKIGNDSFTFPVGKATVYSPIIISAPGNVADAFTGEYFRVNPNTLGSTITASGLFRISGCEYWSLARNVGTSNVNVTLSWSASSPCNSNPYITELETITITHFNGSSWNLHGNDGGYTGTTTSGTITWNNVSSFSPFTLGSTSILTNPLPVKFGDFKAYEEQSGVQLEWDTYSENNVDRFEIQRSSDGRTFTTIGQMSARNLSQKSDYSWFDAMPLPANNFYRIKSIDRDGKTDFTSIIKINFKRTNIGFNIYPNPVLDKQISIQASNLEKGEYVLIVSSSSGQQVFRKVLFVNGGAISQEIKLPASINPGMYSLQLINKLTVLSKAFIVQ